MLPISSNPPSKPIEDQEPTNKEEAPLAIPTELPVPAPAIEAFIPITRKPRPSHFIYISDK